MTCQQIGVAGVRRRGKTWYCVYATV